VSLCVKCARHERTCCQKTEILVTDGDIQRISTYTGKSDFWAYRTPANPDYMQPQPHDPHWLLYTLRPDGTRAQLHQQPSWDCTFLSPTGYTLPTEVRPLICRLYPYDYTEAGLTGTVPGCPLYLLEKGQTLMQGIGMNPEQARQWHQQLYSELQAGSVWHENRHHVRSAS
jgi:Fe-S-cluster containining protein